MHIVIACKACSYFSVIIALTAAVSNTDLYHLDYSDQKMQEKIYRPAPVYLLQVMEIDCY